MACGDGRVFTREPKPPRPRRAANKERADEFAKHAATLCARTAAVAIETRARGGSSFLFWM
jgi:hypothetical protein